MKKSHVLIVIAFCLLFGKIVAQPLTITCDEKVGLGIFPTTYKLEVAGDINYAGSLYTLSDRRLITNVQELDKEVINRLYLLKGISYWKDFSSLFAEVSDSSRKYLNENVAGHKINFGLSAQDVEKVFPEIVSRDAIGYYSIDYTALVPVLIAALADQQAQIDALTAMLGETKLKSAKSVELTQTTIDGDGNSILYQNSPNPFTESTRVEYQLQENVQNAQICIYDLNGSQLKSYPVNPASAGSLIIKDNEFKPGTYIYSLIADGQVVDTKRMVLTD